MLHCCTMNMTILYISDHEGNRMTVGCRYMHEAQHKMCTACCTVPTHAGNSSLHSAIVVVTRKAISSLD